MEFGKPRPKKVGIYEDIDFVGKGCTYVLHIGTGRTRRYIQIRRTLFNDTPRYPDDHDYIRLSPLIRINKKDGILYAQVLKELLLGFKELPEIPSEDAIREVLGA